MYFKNILNFYYLNDLKDFFITPKSLWKIIGLLDRRNLACEDSFFFWAISGWLWFFCWLSVFIINGVITVSFATSLCICFYIITFLVVSIIIIIYTTIWILSCCETSYFPLAWDIRGKWRWRKKILSSFTSCCLIIILLYYFISGRNLQAWGILWTKRALLSKWCNKLGILPL